MQVHRVILRNRLRTLLIETGGAKSATVLLLVGSGSRYESRQNNGIAHFFEHMAFKGSAKYPDSYAISSTIEGIGGIFNAFTAKDHTGYWIKAATENVPLVLDVLSDMVTAPKLEVSEIEKEKGVIIEEMNMYEDMPQSKASNIYDQLLYGAHPLGRTVIGSKETVLTFTRETFTHYMKRLYHPANAVLVVAGGIGAYFKEIEEAVDKLFGGWRSEDTDFSAKYLEYKPGQQRKKITVFNKKTEQAHFILGYVTDFGFGDERKYALGSLAAILGGGMSSRLFIEVRERRGLCYYVHTTSDMFAETGSLATAVGVKCDKKTIHETIELIKLEHQKIIEQTINDKKLIGGDLKRVKQMLKGRFMLSLENSQAVASFYGGKLLLEGKTMTPEEVISKIDEVTIHDIHSVAQQVIRPENARLALVGPFTMKDMPLC